MSEVKISNARRIGFTALALVSFWVLAWQAYRIGSDDWYDSELNNWKYFPWMAATVIALSFSLVPVGLLSLSLHNSPLKIIRDPSIWMVGLALVCVLVFCHGLGGHDSETGLNTYAADKPHPTTKPGFTALYLAAKQAHIVSWLWLLLPLILTTAFVIFAACRRAVRDADAVGEDE